MWGGRVRLKTEAGPEGCYNETYWMLICSPCSPRW